MNPPTLEDIVSLCKRRGFIFPGSELYGGLSGTWDYGPLGTSLKRNIANLWWKFFVEDQDNMFGIDTAILMHPKVWQASGHVETFNDLVVEDVKTKKRYRLDHLLEEQGVDPSDMKPEEMAEKVKELKLVSPDGNPLSQPMQFNLMFETSIGSTAEDQTKLYLRPETAQGMFVNYRNILDTFYPDIPFGVAQIGKSFRNEISPRDFIFRSRELEIMEFEFFVDPNSWEKEFDRLLKLQREWFVEALGIKKEHITEKEIGEAQRAHYSKKTIDFEYSFPIGSKELSGFAYRTDYDLTKHQKLSGKSMEYIPKDGGKRFIPHVLEPAFGLDRHVLAVITESYCEDKINGEKRVYLKLSKNLAPYLVAVSPLLKNKPELVEKAKQVYTQLKKMFGNVAWDDNGNIGKRYRRQDEIGTPFCVTIDFDTLTDDTVTVRDRDTTDQQRVKIDKLASIIK